MKCPLGSGKIHSRAWFSPRFSCDESFRNSLLSSQERHSAQSLDDAGGISSYRSNHQAKAVSRIPELPAERILEMDHLLLSCKLALDPEIAQDLIGGTALQPFQRLMQLETVVVMINRCHFRDQRQFLVGELRRSLGCSTWWSPTMVSRACDLFDRQVSVHCIRRRMGKTVSMYAELAKSMAFFPAARLQSVYTVHNAMLASTCFNRLKTTLPGMVGKFNSKEAAAYRKRCQMGSVGDFYYTAQMFSKESGADRGLFVTFCKVSNSTRAGEACTNVLRCKAYRKKRILSSCFSFTPLVTL